MRYIVVPPIVHPVGYPYWRVADTQSEIWPNFALVEIHKSVEDAEDLVTIICSNLNLGISIKSSEGGPG